jgi:hypothetical protein
MPIFERLKGMKICDVIYQGNSGSIPVVYRSNTLELLFSRCIPYLEFYSYWRFREDWLYLKYFGVKLCSYS